MPTETNTEGPRGTYGCACFSRDSAECAAARYGFDMMHEHCDCVCHQWDEDEEYGPQGEPG